LRYRPLFAIACAACSSSQEHANAPGSVTFRGGDGSDCAAAVQIVGAPDERAGVAAEHAWLTEHYPGYSLVKQTLTDCADRPADRMTIQTAEGVRRDVHFDISGFFGKL
jgi:hypothetical protein